MLIILSIVLLIVFVAIIFFNFAPQIGAEPKGERLLKIQESANFKDGKFQNLVETNMDMSFKDISSTIYEMLKGDSLREPKQQIESLKYDSSKFNQVSDSEIAITWFGHSSALIKMEELTFLIDPVFSERASMFSFMGPKRYNYSNLINIDELPHLDVLMISHDHYDHLDYETIKLIKPKVDQFYVPLGVGSHLEAWGVDPNKIREFDWWDSVDVNKNLQLVFTPSRHFSGRSLTNRFSTLWGSWVFKGKSMRLFFGGDSGYFDGFKEIGVQYGPFDITMLECGQYNERWPNIHMMPEETIQAHIDLKGKVFMPIHWGKFTLSLHPWKEPVKRAEKAAMEQNVKMVTPVIGQNMIIYRTIPTELWWKDVN